MRISAPTYTQTPNDLFDHWLPLLKESELKVLLVIMRKTFGWHKVRDRISISQLAKLTGLTEETVVIATKSLQKKGVIIKQVVGELGKQQTFYELVVEDSNNSYPSENPTGGEIHPPPPLGFTPLGESEAQKKTSITKENDDDDDARAREAEKIIPYEIKVISPSGKKSGFTKSEVYRHFVGKPYKTETIERALKRFIERNDRVSDFYRYLESICATIEANDKQSETKSYTKEKVKKEVEPEKPKQYAEGCGEGGWFEIEKQFKEKLKKQGSHL